MQLTTEVFGDVAVAHAPQEIGEALADAFRAAFQGAPRTSIVLDLDGTEMLDSAGLEALLDVQDSLRERGGELKIATANHANRKILEITRLDREFEVFDAVLDAVKSFH